MTLPDSAVEKNLTRMSSRSIKRCQFARFYFKEMSTVLQCVGIAEVNGLDAPVIVR